ncbi:MAG: hypothetical protein IPM64_10995 [Phycisphaerales bacterium]|nr:hypothetical protein [Phycisphaerales bacterium]
MADKDTDPGSLSIEELLKLEEYKALRTELLENRRFQYQILFGASAATAALLTFAVGQRSSMMCLVPLLVIVPSVRMIAGIWNGTASGAAYLRVFFEEPAALTSREPLRRPSWESALLLRRSHFLEFERISTAAVPFTFLLLGAICFVLSLLLMLPDALLEATTQPAGSNLSTSRLLATIGLNLIGIIVLARSVRRCWQSWNYERHDEHARRWKSVRDMLSIHASRPDESAR